MFVPRDHCDVSLSLCPFLRLILDVPESMNKVTRFLACVMFRRRTLLSASVPCTLNNTHPFVQHVKIRSSIVVTVDNLPPAALLHPFTSLASGHSPVPTCVLIQQCYVPRGVKFVYLETGYVQITQHAPICFLREKQSISL